MEGLQQIGLPVLGIVAAAALTFYAVSFNELREKSLRIVDKEEGGYVDGELSSKQKRAMRKAKRESKS